MKKKINNALKDTWHFYDQKKEIKILLKIHKLNE